MDWVALITMVITTILPLIINKAVPMGVKQFALKRKQVWYDRLAEAALAKGDIVAAFALGEGAGLCACMAAEETDAGQQQLLAAATDAFASTKAQMAAAAKASQTTAA